MREIDEEAIKAGFVAAIFIFAAGAFAYYTPTSYVSLDVNPSLEYTINMFDRVLVVKAVNDDGKDIIFNLELKNKKIAKAVEETIDKLIEEGFITKDENAGIIISVSNSDGNKADDLVNKIKESTLSYLKNKGETAQVEAEAVGLARVEEARKLGITPGKLNLIEKLKNSSSTPDSIVIEEWVDKPVKEINKTIKENRKAEKNNKADDDNDDTLDPGNDEDNDVQKDDKNELNKAKDKEKEKNKKEKDSDDDNKTKDKDKDKDKDDNDDNNGKSNENKNNNGKTSNNNDKSKK